jgi:tetratricopeptide (TPR) repeat protein
MWYGEMLVNLGRFDEAIGHLHTANALDPLTSVIPSNIGWAYHSAGRHEEAVAAFRTALDFDPRFAYAHLGMGSALIGLGRVGEAVTAFESAVEVMKGQEAARAYLARGYARAGRRADAEAIFADLQRSALAGDGAAWGVAAVAAALGRDDDALTWLQVAYDRGEPSMSHVKVASDFRRLQADPRFAAILRQMGF